MQSAAWVAIGAVLAAAAGGAYYALEGLPGRPIVGPSVGELNLTHEPENPQPGDTVHVTVAADREARLLLDLVTFERSSRMGGTGYRTAQEATAFVEDVPAGDLILYWGGVIGPEDNPDTFQLTEPNPIWVAPPNGTPPQIDLQVTPDPASGELHVRATLADASNATVILRYTSMAMSGQSFSGGAGFGELHLLSDGSGYEGTIQPRNAGGGQAVTTVVVMAQDENGPTGYAYERVPA